MDTDRFDVQARMSGDVKSIPRPEQQEMIRALLEDRFQMKVHKETRELQVYTLVVSRSGKLKRSADQTPPDLTGKALLTFDASVPLSRGAVKVTQSLTQAGWALSVMSGSAVPISVLVSRLESNTGRRVIDKTGLTGLYDFNLEFIPDYMTVTTGAPGVSPQEPADRGGPSIFDAVQDQLGLKLESAKAPREVLVIDSVQRPTEN